MLAKPCLPAGETFSENLSLGLTVRAIQAITKEAINLFPKGRFFELRVVPHEAQVNLTIRELGHAPALTYVEICGIAGTLQKYIAESVNPLPPERIRALSLYVETFLEKKGAKKELNAWGQMMTERIKYNKPITLQFFDRETILNPKGTSYYRRIKLEGLMNKGSVAFLIDPTGCYNLSPVDKIPHRTL